jgi:hypothetical protein
MHVSHLLANHLFNDPSAEALTRRFPQRQPAMEEWPHEAGTDKETDGQRRYPWRNRLLGAMLGATLRSVQNPIRYFRWLDPIFEGSRAHYALSV